MASEVFSLSPIWLLPPVAGCVHEGSAMRRLVAFSSTSVMTKAAIDLGCTSGRWWQRAGRRRGADGGVR